MNYHDIAIGEKAPQEVTAFIEIPTGTHNKYEYDADLGVMMLDRVLYSPFFYPVDYGFITQTHGEDGDPLDIMVINDSPVFPGCAMKARPVGMLKMSDEEGVDHKIIAVPVKNPHYTNVHTLEDIPQNIRDGIEHFFAQYKHLENKEVNLDGWASKEEALQIIEEARQRYTA